MRIAIRECGEPNTRQPFLRSSTSVGRRRAGCLEAYCDVLDRGLPGKECIGLKQIAGLAIQRRQRTAENIDGTCGRRKQAGSDVEQSRLATSRGPDDRDEFSICHMKRRAFDSRVEAPVRQTECDYDVIECDCYV